MYVFVCDCSVELDESFGYDGNLLFGDSYAESQTRLFA